MQNSRPRKKNQFQQPKCFKTHLSKETGSFHSAASFLVCLTVPGSSTEKNFSIKPIPKKVLKKNAKKKKKGKGRYDNNQQILYGGEGETTHKLAKEGKKVKKD